MTATMPTDKPFQIDKKPVYEAYKAVRSNQGAAWVDGQRLEAFEKGFGGQPLQNLEADGFGQLLPAAGTCSLHSQEEWGR